MRCAADGRRKPSSHDLFAGAVVPRKSTVRRQVLEAAGSPVVSIRHYRDRQSHSRSANCWAKDVAYCCARKSAGGCKTRLDPVFSARSNHLRLARAVSKPPTLDAARDQLRPRRKTTNDRTRYCTGRKGLSRHVTARLSMRPLSKKLQFYLAQRANGIAECRRVSLERPRPSLSTIEATIYNYRLRLMPLLAISFGGLSRHEQAHRCVSDLRDIRARP